MRSIISLRSNITRRQANITGVPSLRMVSQGKGVLSDDADEADERDVLCLTSYGVYHRIDYIESDGAPEDGGDKLSDNSEQDADDRNHAEKSEKQTAENAEKQA